MIAPDRHRNILERVLTTGSARVAELARELDVTEETIRRDLRTMAERGVVQRIHGGAVAPAADAAGDLPWVQRHATHQRQKDAIARAAVRTIRPGQVIALDPSSTACRLARLIPDVPLTVVTNSLAICHTLADRPSIEVLCTGGTLDSEAMAFFGLPTQAALEKLNVERLFFSCRGVDLERGLSESNDRHAAAKLAMIGSSRSRTLLVDTSKLGLASTVLYAPVNVADRVIVDRPASPAATGAVARLREAGLDVEEADPFLGLAEADAA